MYKLDKKELQRRQEMRGNYPEELRWYAVMVHYGHEKRVRLWLEETMAEWRQGGEHLSEFCAEEVLLPILSPGARMPARRVETSSRLLFPSYLFLRCGMNDEIYTAVIDHPSVYQIVGRSYRIPSVLEDEEILYLKGILESGGTPEMIEKCDIGDTVEIVQGLMAGMRGRVLTVSSDKVRLEVSFSFLDMGTSVAVTVSRSDVRIENDGYLELTEERA